MPEISAPRRHVTSTIRPCAVIPVRKSSEPDEFHAQQFDALQNREQLRLVDYLADDGGRVWFVVTCGIVDVDSGEDLE
jgi:hypothetical protein